MSPLSENHQVQIRDRHVLFYAPEYSSRKAAIEEHGDKIEAVLTLGNIGLTSLEIAAMPNLSFIGSQGVGYERIDVAAAKSRGITVCNGAGTNAASVADHAMALLLATIRRVPEIDAATRAGVWRTELPMLPAISGKRFGIVGLGAIGQKPARRAAGFEMEVAYHSRRQVPHAGYFYFDSLQELAVWCDILALCLPGGPDSHHLVGDTILNALGPSGYLVNIARGSIVDTPALARALRSGAIAGAAIDVYESELVAPSELIDLPNVVLSPHLAARSPNAMNAMIDLFMENIRRHFAGETVLTPV